MNKVLHALVYVLLVVAGAALFFELKLYDKRALLMDRNRMLEDYLVRIAATVEKADAQKSSTLAEARKDVSPTEARLVETPETENLLEDYQLHLEESNLETFRWDDKERVQLRQLYKLDAAGERIPDMANPGDFVKKGPGTAQELLDQLFARAKAQQAKLNTTRAELANLRGKIEQLVADYNKVKPEVRQEKVLVEETKAKIPPIEKERDEAQEQVKRIKGQIDDLNSEVASLKDEVTSAKDETEAVKEDLAKAQKKNEQLQKYLRQQASVPRPAAGAAGAANVAKLTAGEKGSIVEADNKIMFAVIEFTDDAIKEMLGADRQGGLPQIEIGVRRKGFNGPAGEYVGRVKLRQAIPDKNYVVADILGDWVQAPMEKGDAVIAD